MKSKKVKGKKAIKVEEEKIEEEKEKEKEKEEKEEEKEEKAKEEGEKFDFQLETVTHAEHVTPILKTAPEPSTQPEFKLENFLEGVEVKKPEEKKKEEFKYSPSLYGEGPKYFGEVEKPRDWEAEQEQNIRAMIRPKPRAAEIREVADISIKPERRTRATPFIETERFEEVIKYERAEKQASRPQELEPEFKERHKKIRKYEPVY